MCLKVLTLWKGWLRQGVCFETWHIAVGGPLPGCCHNTAVSEVYPRLRHPWGISLCLYSRRLRKKLGPASWSSSSSSKRGRIILNSSQRSALLANAHNSSPCIPVAFSAATKMLFIDRPWGIVPPPTVDRLLHMLVFLFFGSKSPPLEKNSFVLFVSW